MPFCAIEIMWKNDLFSSLNTSIRLVYCAQKGVNESFFKDSVEQKKDFKFNDGKEDHRVFAKGFKINTTREEIDKIFGEVGTIVDVRLPETRQVITVFNPWAHTGSLKDQQHIKVHVTLGSWFL